MKIRKNLPLVFSLILGSGTVGISLKLFRSLGYWVYSPWFPDVLDCALLFLTGVYLLWLSVCLLGKRDEKMADRDDGALSIPTETSLLCVPPRNIVFGG